MQLLVAGGGSGGGSVGMAVVVVVFCMPKVYSHLEHIDLRLVMVAQVQHN